MPESEDLEVFLWPFLWAIGSSDSYVMALRRDDLPDDNEHWLSVLAFVREYGLEPHETWMPADLPAPPGTTLQRWIWTTPETRWAPVEELSADVRQRLGALLLDDNLRLPWE